MGIFGPLKRAFHDQIRGFATLSANTAIAKQRFIRAYAQARITAITDRNAKYAFRGAGMWPTNVDRVMEGFVEGAALPRLITPPHTRI